MNSHMALTFVALLAASSVHAGVRIETVTRDTATGKDVATNVLQVQDGMARIESGRIESNSARSSASIFKNDTMYVLDGQRKTYMLLDRATLERTANSMNQAMEQMRAQMAAMPPEQRAKMEQMMKQNGMGGMAGTGSQTAPVIDAKAVGGNGTYQGKSCKLWNVTRDGVLSQQLCVVPFSSLPGAGEMRELSKKMQAFLNSLTGPMRQMMNNQAMQSPDLANKIGGFPVITRQYKDGVLSTEESVVNSWQTQKIDAAQFEIPAGYTKQEMPAMPAPK
jgi:hypothetical protein